MQTQTRRRTTRRLIRVSTGGLSPRTGGQTDTVTYLINSIKSRPQNHTTLYFATPE